MMPDIAPSVSRHATPTMTVLMPPPGCTDGISALRVAVPNRTRGESGDAPRLAHENAISTIANTIIATMPATIAEPQSIVRVFADGTKVVAITVSRNRFDPAEDARCVPSALPAPTTDYRQTARNPATTTLASWRKRQSCQPGADVLMRRCGNAL